MKYFAFIFFAISLFLPNIVTAEHSDLGLDLCPDGARIEDYVDRWRNGEWELQIGNWGDVEITRYSDYHYRGRSDTGFRLRRDFSTPTGYSLEGRYTVTGKDGTFRGRMTLYFCNSFSKDRLCGNYRTDTGQSFTWRPFWRN